MYITKSDELHMELEANKAEAKAALREMRTGEVNTHYARCTVNNWDESLDVWEYWNVKRFDTDQEQYGTGSGDL